MGHTTRTGGRPLFEVVARNGTPVTVEDGCSEQELRVMGTYIHGLFDSPAVTARWLTAIGVQGVEPPALAGLAARDREYDALADHFEKHVDVEAIYRLAQGARCRAQG
jgi:adenosylcobyric acid synthase